MEGVSELKPCPFCGGEAVLYDRPGKTKKDGSLSHVFWGKCSECSAKSKSSTSPTEATETWNTRHERTCHVLPYAPDYSQGAFDKDGRCSECGHIGYFKSDHYKHCPNCTAKVVEQWTITPSSS